MEQEIRLAMVHQNRLFRDCLASVLEKDDPSLRVAPLTFGDHDSLVPQLERGNVDVVVIDLHFPTSFCLQLVGQIRRHLPAVRILLMVPHERRNELIDLLDSGIHGCLPDEGSLEELASAVREVAQGKTFCSPDLAQAMFAELTNLTREGRWRQRCEEVELTRREIDVLRCIAQRMSNKQVAKELSVSLYTVKNHVHRILEKLHVADRHEAVDLARQRHWLEP